MADNRKIMHAKGIGADGNIDGFIGKFRITRDATWELENDAWCEGTQYYIYDFATTTDQFKTRCLNLIAKDTPPDIFSIISNLNIERCYLPMVDCDDVMVCLNNDAMITYSLLNKGHISKREITAMFGELKPFDGHDYNLRAFRFLPIVQGFHDVSYTAGLHGKKFDQDSAPEVSLIPVYRMTFDLEGTTHYIYSWGDKELSQITATPLPKDPFICDDELKYSRPYITIAFSLATMLGAIYFICSTYIWMYNYFSDWYLVFKILIWAIPLFIIYYLMSSVLSSVFNVIGNIFISFDSKIAISQAQRYNSQARERKIADAKDVFGCDINPKESKIRSVTSVENYFNEWYTKYTDVSIIMNNLFDTIFEDK